MSTGYENNDKLVFLSLLFPFFSLNCIILLSQLKGARHDKNHVISVCAGTWDCTNKVLFFGSIPHAKSVAAVFSVNT
jgi:hypothetical protein